MSEPVESKTNPTQHAEIKPRYESPTVLNLTALTQGEGGGPPCGSGSAPSGDCATGPSASSVCNGGATAFVTCTTGPTVSTGCTTGFSL